MNDFWAGIGTKVRQFAGSDIGKSITDFVTDTAREKVGDITQEKQREELRKKDLNVPTYLQSFGLPEALARIQKQNYGGKLGSSLMSPRQARAARFGSIETEESSRLSHLEYAWENYLRKIDGKSYKMPSVKSTIT